MIRLASILLMVLLFSFQAVHAQTVATEPQTTDEQSVDSPSTNQENLEPEFEIAAVDEPVNEETDEEEESSARFIPTEQISQDLGVSFPVDI